MTVADNLPYLQECCKLISAAGFGGVLMLIWVISYNNPEKAYVAADNLIMLCMVIASLSGALWLMLDMDRNTDIEIREKL
jgi:hypothetical protein